jgi:hypothetical protein
MRPDWMRHEQNNGDCCSSSDPGLRYVAVLMTMISSAYPAHHRGSSASMTYLFLSLFIFTFQTLSFFSDSRDFSGRGRGGAWPQG